MAMRLRTRLRRRWRKVPLYWRITIAGAAVFGFGQGGFALMNVANTLSVISGVACLLIAAYLAYRTLTSTIQEIQ